MKTVENQILLKEKVTVKATASNPYEKEGKEVEMHPRVAEHVIKKGFYAPIKKGKE